jgi:signal transduction histidine kinase/Tfp pilus assembly protein PilF
MRKILLLPIVLFSLQIQAQQTYKNIDSLLQKLKSSKEDTSKVMLYHKISSHYNITHLDSSKAFSEAGIKLAEQLQFSEGKMFNLNNIGNYYERKTDYVNAMLFYDEALEIAKSENSTKGFAVVLNNIATIHIRKAEYDKAIQLLFDALKAEEELGNENGIAQAYNNIGVCYYYQRNFEKTTFYLTKALEIQEQLGNYDGLINGYNNVGAILDHQKKYDEAIQLYTKGLTISRKINDKKLEAIQLYNIGIAYHKKDDFIQSEDYINRSTKLRESIKDYNGMANNYLGYSDLFAKMKKFNKAKTNLNKALTIAEKYNLKLIKQESFKGLSELAEIQNNYKKANNYLQQYIAIKDTILNENNSKIIAEVETKYQTEKKEKEILLQRADLAEQKLDISKKNNYILGLSTLAIVLSLLGYLFYNQQRLKTRQLQKENELKEVLIKIETQNHLQEQRLRISRDLHDNIGAQLTFIISSLDNLKYVFKIPKKLSSKLKNISQFTTTTIYELRDTIWAMNKSEITFEDLKSRITNFIDKANISTTNTKFEFICDDNIDKTKTFSSVDGMNIYRIIQESINNAIKYANPKSISVTIVKKNKSIAISISDDGVGFNSNDVELGNGLNNMKKRSLELNAGFLIDSKKEKGTTIQLLVPINT